MHEVHFARALENFLLSMFQIVRASITSLSASISSLMSFLVQYTFLVLCVSLEEVWAWLGLMLPFQPVSKDFRDYLLISHFFRLDPFFVFVA